MKLLSEIRKKTGNFLLKREISKVDREKRICNLRKAHEIGVLYYLDNEQTYNTVSAFVKQLQESGKVVKALGYVESKSLTGQFLPRLSYDFLYPSGVNWNYKPVSQRSKDFMDTKFDILIDLGMEDSLPLLYLGGLSRAGFKVGLQGRKRQEYLDLMINLPGDGSLEELIKQIRHYISEINKDNEN